MTSTAEMYEGFRPELLEMAQKVDELLLGWERTPADPHVGTELFKQIHSLKGACGFVELFEVADLCHAAEDLLTRYSNPPRVPPLPAMRLLGAFMSAVQSVLSTPEFPQGTMGLEGLAAKLRDFDRHEPQKGDAAWIRSLALPPTEAARTSQTNPGHPDTPPPPSRPSDAARRQRREKHIRSLEARERELLGSRLLSNTSPSGTLEAVIGPWSRHRLAELSRGRAPKELLAEAMTVREGTLNLEPESVDPLELLLGEDAAAEAALARLEGDPSTLALLTQALEGDADPRPPSQGTIQNSLPFDLSPDAPPAREALEIDSGVVARSKLANLRPEELDPPTGERPLGGTEKRADAPSARPLEAPAKRGEERNPGTDGGGAERMSTIRVDVSKLDTMVTLLGQLLQERQQMAELLDDLLASEGSTPLVSKVIATHRRFGQTVGELRDVVLSTRMLPMSVVFRRYPRIVRDFAARVGRDVALEVEGGDTEIDRALLEGLFEPLIHLLRNAIDHGIEPPEVRIEARKPACGRIRLRATQEGNQIVLEVVDDGAGIDAEAVTRRAIDLGVIRASELKELSEQEKLDLIFLPGFTMRESVGETSGRGVGMSLVREHLRRTGGTIRVSSRVGQGTLVRLSLPLTLAILPILLVRVGITRFAIPLSAVLFVGRLEREQLTLYRGAWYLPRGHALIPAFSLGGVLGLHDDQLPPKKGYGVLIGVAEKRFALWVDGFAGIHESVIKALDATLTRLPGVMGGTYVGGGDLVMVLDPGMLIEALPIARAQA